MGNNLEFIYEKPMVIEDDLEFLYECFKLDLRDDLEAPSLDQHRIFIESTPYLEFNIIIDKNENKIGYIYFTKKHELGLYICSDYCGNGVGSSVLHDMLKKHPEIDTSNGISMHTQHEKMYGLKDYRKILV